MYELPNRNQVTPKYVILTVSLRSRTVTVRVIITLSKDTKKKSNLWGFRSLVFQTRNYDKCYAWSPVWNHFIFITNCWLENCNRSAGGLATTSLQGMRRICIWRKFSWHWVHEDTILSTLLLLWFECLPSSKNLIFSLCQL